MLGGVLISIIVITLFYIMFDRVSQYASSTSDNSQQKELIAFNQGFESYNKKLMYGSDVISVINKAIDNNKKYDIENDNTDGYYVDIAIILTSDLQTVEDKYTRTGDRAIGYPKTLLGSSLKVGTYYLSKPLDYNRIINAIINPIGRQR